jgi:aminoglycoside phosphotransferase (APT) family kinase protein
VPPGLDLERIAPFVRAATGALTGPLTASVITGGRSNLTYIIDGGSRRVVLRRPPLGHVLPSAHDMSREFRVTEALSGAGYPVAEPLLLCSDADVIGAPFYLMEYVDGVVMRSSANAPDAAGARRCGDLLVDTLVRLHDIDPDSIGLTGVGHPDGYLERQVHRWHKQWTASQTRPLPRVNTVTTALLEALPDSHTPGIVHGDYRLDNVMFTPDLSAIAAVMDWEMATVGDPLADVGLLVVYTELSRLGLIAAVPAGFPNGPELAGRYAVARGVDVDRLDWYIALGTYKLAIISEGIHARHLQGKTVGEGFDAFGPAVPLLIDRAAATLGLVGYAADG